MKWKRIPKENAQQPTSGKYSDWKQQLAEEGFHQCVYCALHDATFDVRNFHVEHYKPKSNRRFRHLENDIKNLFYACPVCNVFKSDSWPCAPKKDHSKEAFPDPSKCDYCDLFEVNESTGEVKGKFVASKFLVIKLHLNRPQLITERRIFYMDEIKIQLVSPLRLLFSQLKEEADNGDNKASTYCEKLFNIMCDLEELDTAYRRISPYSDGQLR